MFCLASCLHPNLQNLTEVPWVSSLLSNLYDSQVKRRFWFIPLLKINGCRVSWKTNMTFVSVFVCVCLPHLGSDLETRSEVKWFCKWGTHSVIVSPIELSLESAQFKKESSHIRPPTKKELGLKQKARIHQWVLLEFIVYLVYPCWDCTTGMHARALLGPGPVLRVRKSHFHCFSSLQKRHFWCPKCKSETCSEIKSVTW